MKLSRQASQLLVVDFQERLAPAMAAGTGAVEQALKLLRCAQRLQVPPTISEQYPKGIGPTLPSIRDAAGAAAAIFEKMSFSVMQDEAIARHVNAAAHAGRNQIVVCGIEAHVCVLQSALDLVTAGHHVAVVVDATASRAPDSKEAALRRLASHGIDLVTTEMVIFEWLERAGTEEFRALLPLLK